MIFKNITVMCADGSIIPDRYVRVSGSRIDFVCGENEAPNGDFGRVIDGKGKLLMPGMVNAHTHVPMTLLRGYGEDMALAEWLNTRIFPFEDKLTADDVYWGSLLGMAEMMSTGTTSITDMYNFCGDIARAAAESGIKANISRPVLCFDPSLQLTDLPAYNEVNELVASVHGADDGRIIVDASVHAEYTSRPEIVEQTAEMAKSMGLRMHIHLSETAEEHRECIGRWGKTPARVMFDAGLLDLPVTAAHCVWLTDSDMDILAAHSVNVTHCPQSNMKLAGGIAMIEKMRAKGINVALGTDSAASNNNLNMLEEARAAALLAKGMSLNPAAVPAGDAIFMLTRAGALSQGRIDCGDIVPGYRADFTVINMDTPCMTPCHNAAANVLYSAGSSEILMTVIDGRVVYENGAFTTIDIERAKFEVNSRAQRIAAEV